MMGLRRHLAARVRGAFGDGVTKDIGFLDTFVAALPFGRTGSDDRLWNSNSGGWRGIQKENFIMVFGVATTHLLFFWASVCRKAFIVSVFFFFFFHNSNIETLNGWIGKCLLQSPPRSCSILFTNSIEYSNWSLADITRSNYNILFW